MVCRLQTSLNYINETLYYIAVQIKKLFNLDCIIPIQEDELRKTFPRILDLGNQRLQKSVVLGQKIVLIIENIDLIVEDDPQKPNLVKYWLPRFFPDRYRVIISANQHSSVIDRKSVV